MAKRYVGIDLGGTNLKLGLVSADGAIVKRHSSPTEAARGPDHVLERMAQAVNPYGDGRAADRIADHLEYHFGLRPLPPQPFAVGEPAAG
jgi:predicted NBD/HSP70 family sugar kinase